MSFTNPAPTQPAGLAAALVVVRLVMALLEAWFAEVGDLPADHPDRRLHVRLMVELTRAEARIRAGMDEAARTAPPRPTRARHVPSATAGRFIVPGRTRAAPRCGPRFAAIPGTARAPPFGRAGDCNPASAGDAARQFNYVFAINFI
ncbi:MAG: hypothetical protein NT133_16130 [Alphaproteobacteria bacterium]|nr:hypothetical protein [Alphaproteobacteria bacterium]